MISRKMSIILVEPKGDLNIGSVCRAMQNFGCNDLRLVNPRIDHLGGNARKMAVKATGLLENATVFKDLDEAVADINLLFGTTRRFGQSYREDFIDAAAAAERISTAPPEIKCGLIFGREDKGLTNEELGRCHHFVTIPTSSEHASLNLAQAVCICLYEIYRHSLTNAPLSPAERIPAPAAEMEGMLQHMRATLLDLDFLIESNPDHILHTFRRIFGRTELDSREVSILRGLWKCLDDLDRPAGPDKK